MIELRWYYKTNDDGIREVKMALQYRYRAPDFRLHSSRHWGDWSEWTDVPHVHDTDKDMQE